MVIRKKFAFCATGIFVFWACSFSLLLIAANSAYSESSASRNKKQIFSAVIPTAAPALVPAGRNIAFESGNPIANAPASYLNLLDCCESDEAITERLSLGDLQAVLLPKRALPPKSKTVPAVSEKHSKAPAGPGMSKSFSNTVVQ